MNNDVSRPTIAVSGYELEDSDGPSAVIDGARAAGVDTVELWHPATLGVDRTIEVLDEAHLRCVCVTTQTDLVRPYGADANHRIVIEAIELAARVGAPFTNA